MEPNAEYLKYFPQLRLLVGERVFDCEEAPSHATPPLNSCYWRLLDSRMQSSTSCALDSPDAAITSDVSGRKARLTYKRVLFVLTAILRSSKQPNSLLPYHLKWQRGDGEVVPR